MDRDAGAALPLTPADAVPPFSPRFVQKTGLFGVGSLALAVLIGAISLALGDSIPSDLTNGLRLLLVFVGVVTTGSAISMRPDLWWTWGFGTVASLLAVFGLPNQWDSFQMFFSVVTGVSAVGMVICRLSAQWRILVVSAILLFHFSGIFMATTAPPSTPWLTEQLFRRIYNPYLQFLYLRNAYHFYSPEPGPASILAFFIKTEKVDPVTGQKESKTEWIVSPRRPANVRDPLGLGYYRLLSLNEQTSRGSPGLATPSDQFEKTEMYYRRSLMQYKIPFHPVETHMVQYKLPNQDIARYVLPSYASHVIVWNTPDPEAAKNTTVKVYRLEHRDLPPDRLSKGDSPYHPSTYRPYFLGEFDAYGRLLDPRERFLYWMIPIIPDPTQQLPNDPANPYMKDYTDYLSVHALDLTPQEVRRENVTNGRVFNWSQLR